MQISDNIANLHKNETSQHECTNIILPYRNRTVDRASWNPLQKDIALAQVGTRGAEHGRVSTNSNSVAAWSTPHHGPFLISAVCIRRLVAVITFLRINWWLITKIRAVRGMYQTTATIIANAITKQISNGQEWRGALDVMDEGSIETTHCARGEKPLLLRIW